MYDSKMTTNGKIICLFNLSLDLLIERIINVLHSHNEIETDESQDEVDFTTEDLTVELPKRKKKLCIV